MTIHGIYHYVIIQFGKPTALLKVVWYVVNFSQISSSILRFSINEGV